MILVIDTVMILVTIFCMALVLGVMRMIATHDTTASSLFAGILVYVFVVAVAAEMLFVRASIQG